MLHLFLTSSPCNDDVPEGVSLPCIFFERNGFVQNLRSCVRQNARFVVIAADPESYELNDEMANTFASCFVYHGMMISSLEVLDARTAHRAAELIFNSDLILLGGGHVPTEHAFFEAIGLRELLRGYDGVVMGVSAGSMNCAATVYAQPECPGESIDPAYRRFIHGLELTDVMVLPHYQKARHFMLDGRRLYEDITYADSYGRNFIALPDGSYVVQANGRIMVFGEAYRVSEGRIKRICTEESCIMLWK